MTSTVVISVRIPAKLKEELDKRGVNISELVRKKLEEELEKLEEEEFLEELEYLRKHVGPRIPIDLIVQVIRETRDER